MAIQAVWLTRMTNPTASNLAGAGTYADASRLPSIRRKAPVTQEPPAGCQLCGNRRGNKVLRAIEMMYGLREAFEYLECRHCHALTLMNIPTDMTPYYQHGYLQSSGRLTELTRSVLLGVYLAKPRLNSIAAIGDRLFPGRLPCIIRQFLLLRREGPRHSSILDVGCGNGELLREMRFLGFDRMVGIDPFAIPVATTNRRIVFIQCTLDDVSDQFDYVMMNHSFEHIANPRRALVKMQSIMNHNSVLMIRTPLADSDAYRNYGTAWAQLDPPRHLVVHTKESLSILASETGFSVVGMTYDSNAFQFWGSELISRGVPLRDAHLSRRGIARGILSGPSMNEFRRQARELNARQSGDQAAIFLRPV